MEGKKVRMNWVPIAALIIIVVFVLLKWLVGMLAMRDLRRFKK